MEIHATLKQTVKNHALYEADDPRGIPFWFSPPAMITVLVLVLVIPVWLSRKCRDTEIQTSSASSFPAMLTIAWR